MGLFTFGWMLFAIGLLIGYMLGRHDGYKEAHDDFCRHQANFYKYCMKDEYIDFLKKYNIPMTKRMKETFSEDVNPFERNRLINEFRAKCEAICEREK